MSSREVLLHYEKNGRSRRASGYRIRDGYVLTAGHCAQGQHYQVWMDGIEYPAAVEWRSENTQIDLAVVHAPGLGPFPAVDCRLLDRTEAVAVPECEAVGFPEWQRQRQVGQTEHYGDEDRLRGYTRAAHVQGTVPVRHNYEPMIGPIDAVPATLRLSDTYPQVQESLEDDPLWAGMSGAGVIHTSGGKEILLGVVASWHRASGVNALTVTPFNALAGLAPSELNQLLALLDQPPLPRWLKLPSAEQRGRRASKPDDELLTQHFLKEIKAYCLTLPQWVPSRLSFHGIWQPLDVVNTPSPGEKEVRRPAGSETPGGEVTVATTDAAAGHRLAGGVAPTLFLVSGPGTGKSWYLRHLALEAAERYAPDDPLRPLPCLVSARLLEGALPDDQADNAALITALARALPHGLAGALQDDHIADLTRNFESDPVLLLIDGYDEISQAGARLGELLPRICGIISGNGGRVIVTSRPGSLPSMWDVSAEWASLRSLTLQQRIALVQTWFSADSGRSQWLSTWLRTNRFEALASPLLLTLFCSDAEGRAASLAPASTEHDLWARALRFLAGQTHRDRPKAPTSPTVRCRINLLTEIARLFVRGSEIATEIDADEVRNSLIRSPAWANLQCVIGHIDPLDDLVGSGLLYVSEKGALNGVGFFHSACRDYLIAKSLRKGDSWMDYVPRIWSQPEWEPVFRYLGAIHEAPNDVLQTLVWQFESDPFNAARFAAGGLVAGAKDGALSAEWQRQVVNELLIIVGSSDAEDARRAVLLLAAIGGDEILEALTSLLTPSLVTPIIVRASEALAAWPYDTAIHALRRVVLSPDFTAEEREAAVRSIASVGTELAGELVREFARNWELPSRARATAAISALRSFSDPLGALSILYSDAESEQATQRLLAERLATDTTCFAILHSIGQFDRGLVADPYAAAVLGWVHSQAAGRTEFVDRVLTSPGLTLSLRRIDELYGRTIERFEYASFLHFVLETAGQESARRLRGVWPHIENTTSCEEAWSSYISESVRRQEQPGAQFLARLAVSGPAPLRHWVRAGIDSGALPSLVGSFAQSMPEGVLVGVPPRSGVKTLRPPRPQAVDTTKQESIEELLDDDGSSVEKYSTLKVRQREIDSQTPLFERIAHLTDKVSTKFATEWIDCLPRVAPALEVRLIQARWAHRSCQIELTSLRAHWPGRWREAVNTSREPEPAILSATAAAYFVAGEYEDARTSALAAIGAASVRKAWVSRQTVIALAGSASLIGGFHEMVYPWVIERARSTGDVHARVAAAWCVLPRDPGTARRLCEELPRWAQAGSADYFALRHCLDGNWPGETDSLTSWFEVQRTERMLRALIPRMRERAARTKAERTADYLAEIAVGLAMAWPIPRTNSPTEIGRARWHWAVTSRATSLLLAGKQDEAAQLFLSLVEDSPHDPVLLNNYGFCMMAIDSEVAATNLKQAASAFGYPWVVNIANRMLVHYRGGDYVEALRLGRLYAEGGGRLSGGTATLWHMDDTKTILESADPEAYVFEIARRCLLHSGDEDMERFWHRYMRSHAMSGSGVHDDGC